QSAHTTMATKSLNTLPQLVHGGARMLSPHERIAHRDQVVERQSRRELAPDVDGCGDPQAFETDHLSIPLADMVPNHPCHTRSSGGKNRGYVQRTPPFENRGQGKTEEPSRGLVTEEMLGRHACGIGAAEC